MPVRFTERFVKQYEKLPQTIQKKVDRALHLLDTDFRHPGLHSHRVEGHENIFEACVSDKYRFTFERQGAFFVMRNVDNHDECLRNP